MLHWRSVVVAGAVVFTAVFGSIYCYYLVKKKDGDDDDGNLDNQLPEYLIDIEVKIPKSAVGAVIGRHGANIDALQARTFTIITIKDDSDSSDERTCLISGRKDDVARASQLLLSAVADQPVIIDSAIFVPQSTVGRIIGHGGETIRNLMHSSGARISVTQQTEEPEPTQEIQTEGMRRVSLKGTQDQIEAAKVLINGKVEEELLLRQQINETAAARVPRHLRPLTPSSSSSRPRTPEQLSLISNLSSDSSTGDSSRYLDAFVSAVDHAGHFWIQAADSNSVQLDKLVDEMTEYYDVETSREIHELDQVSVGDVVVAKFGVDNRWYRGRVTEVSTEESQQQQVTVYFLDYGDTETVPLDRVCELRTDFLRLKFQAVECLLADVEPSDGGAKWCDEASDLFEELAEAAVWRVVRVLVQGYNKLENDQIIPAVRIIGPQGDAAEELVHRGYARWTKKTEVESEDVKEALKSSLPNGSLSNGRTSLVSS